MVKCMCTAYDANATAVAQKVRVVPSPTRPGYWMLRGFVEVPPQPLMRGLSRASSVTDGSPRATRKISSDTFGPEADLILLAGSDR
jgi:hypothetical protein